MNGSAMGYTSNVDTPDLTVGVLGAKRSDVVRVIASNDSEPACPDG
jgi:hypothetical protein